MGYGALIIGLLLIAFFGGYLYGHRHGIAEQFERQSLYMSRVKRDGIIF